MRIAYMDHTSNYRLNETRVSLTIGTPPINRKAENIALSKQMNRDHLEWNFGFGVFKTKS